VERAASELLRAIRGQRSQIAFARRLGYRGNPITDWERGERFPTALETLRAVHLSRIDVLAACARFAPRTPLRRDGTSYALAAWLDELRGSATSGELARRAGYSRDAVGRWLRGDTEPRLPDFLKLLDAVTGRAAEWVAELVPIEAVPSLAPAYRVAVAAKQLAFELPWTEAVLRALETASAKRAGGGTAPFVARTLGIELAEATKNLEALAAAGAVEHAGERFVVRGTSSVDTQGGGREAVSRLKRHWSAVAAERAAAPQAEDLLGYNVVSLSRRDLALARAKLQATFRELRALVATSTPEEVVAVVNLQLVSFDPER
jgi:transcriptional regulator with XRE-family HTH domain